MKKLLIIPALAFTACTVTSVEWKIAGSNEANATIDVAYTYSVFTIPKLEEEQALELALKACKGWKDWDYYQAEELPTQTKSVAKFTQTSEYAQNMK